MDAGQKTEKTVGLYLHIPFCRSKCLYCDFCSFVGKDEEKMRLYADALCRDLAQYAPRLQGHTVDTVYFGGGTPTLLPPELLASVLDCVFSHYLVSDDAEITAECNPATADEAAFSILRHAGFNRLSIGVQSANSDELRAIGRRHRFSDAERTVWQAKRAGFDNLSVDVMFGLPLQTRESYLHTLEQVCTLPVTHLSAYALTLEEGTPLCRLVDEGRVQIPDEEETEAMYFGGIEYLRSKGFAQYEISNFARVGYESRHNLKYWYGHPYLGLGVAAHSDLFGERFGNSYEIDAYISGEDVTEERSRPDQRERKNEYLMLRLRLCQGIDEGEFFRLFGVSFWESYEELLTPYLEKGYLIRRDGRCALTPKGFYISNHILSDLLDFSD